MFFSYFEYWLGYSSQKSNQIELKIYYTLLFSHQLNQNQIHITLFENSKFKDKFNLRILVDMTTTLYDI
jgi:hypothetical protein